MTVPIECKLIYRSDRLEGKNDFHLVFQPARPHCLTVPVQGLQKRVVRAIRSQPAFIAAGGSGSGQADSRPIHFDFLQAVEIHTRGAAFESHYDLVGDGSHRDNINFSGAAYTSAIGHIATGRCDPRADTEILRRTELPRTSIPGNLSTIPVECDGLHER